MTPVAKETAAGVSIPRQSPEVYPQLYGHDSLVLPEDAVQSRPLKSGQRDKC